MNVRKEFREGIQAYLMNCWRCEATRNPCSPSQNCPLPHVKYSKGETGLGQWKGVLSLPWRLEFQLGDAIYEKWLSYKEKNGFGHDSGALFHLLEELRYSEDDILNIIYDAVMCIVEASGVASEEQLEKTAFMTHSLCECPSCTKEKCWAHTNERGIVYVSRKHVADMLQHNLLVPIGLLDFMECYLHEVVHNLYPHAPKDIFISKRHRCSTLVREKTREIWLKGMTKIFAVRDGLNRGRKHKS